MQQNEFASVATVTAAHLVLRDYLLQQGEIGKAVYSPQFEFEGHAFHLEVYPWGKERLHSRYLSAYLASSHHEKKGHQAAKFSAHHTLSVRCYRLPGLLSKTTRVTYSEFSDKESSWGWHELCSLDTLKAKLLDPDTLTITSTLFALCGDLAPASTITVVPDAAASDHELLATLDDEDAFPDCAVRSSDGGAFRCHRVVLCTASAVFKAAFSIDMREAQQQAMTITTDADTLRLFLHHIYGAARLEVPLPNLVPLLQLADQYQLPRLQHVLHSAVMGLTYSQPAAWLVCRQASHIRDIEITTHLLGVLAKLVDWDAADDQLAAHLEGWQEADVALLLEASDSSYIAIRVAMHWAAVHVQYLPPAPPAPPTPTPTTPAPATPSPPATAPTSPRGRSRSPAAHPLPAAPSPPLPHTRHRWPVVSGSSSPPGSPAGACASLSLEHPASDDDAPPTPTSAPPPDHAPHRSPPDPCAAPPPPHQGPDEGVHPAWEKSFCPLMSFKRLDGDQLRAVHGCRGAATIPRPLLNAFLVEGWNSWFDRNKGPEAGRGSSSGGSSKG